MSMFATFATFAISRFKTPKSFDKKLQPGDTAPGSASASAPSPMFWPARHPGEMLLIAKRLREDNLPARGERPAARGERRLPPAA